MIFKGKTYVNASVDLVNCSVISSSSLVSFFDSFLEVLNAESASSVRKDTFIFVILSALPWCGKFMSKNEGIEFERIMNTLDEYIRNRKSIHVEFLRVWRSAEPHEQIGRIDSLWKQILNMARAESNWDDHEFILRPYIAFEGLLTEATQQA